MTEYLQRVVLTKGEGDLDLAPPLMKLLVIGGTRNMGYFLSRALLEAGHELTLLNRGLSPDDLPDHVSRLRCDRTDHRQMRRALQGRRFDAVIDMTIYRGEEAEMLVELLRDRVARYIVISTGQVYLVREGMKPPCVEDDYEGPLRARPDPNTYDDEEWLYGVEKRMVEDTLARAYAEFGFPYTALRLPMVNSERDNFKRLYSYMLRLKDGGPILIPDAPDLPLRHIDAVDVVQAIMRLLDSDQGLGRAYNISQDETLSLDEFLALLGEFIYCTPTTLRVSRATLEAEGFLPDCSPFSELWMSALDNTRSKQELGMVYTPVRETIGRIVSHYQQHPSPPPVGYSRRAAELQLAQSLV